MDNLLKNPDFEEGWWRKTHTGEEFDNIFVPTGWTAWWKEGPAEHDPQNTNGYTRPEMMVISKEDPYLDPPRVYYGQNAVKMFTFYKIHQAGLYQTIDVEEFYSYKASGWVHAWSSTEDYPYESDQDSESDIANFTFYVGIDPTGGTDPWSEDIVWSVGRPVYDAYGSISTGDVEATANTNKITVFIKSDVMWPFKHCDAYFDNFLLTQEEYTPCTPSCPPEECKGLPRVDYERTYDLVSQNISFEDYITVADEVFSRKGTIGFSADDAGIGDLTLKRVNVWWFNSNDWNEQEINDFFTTYYNNPPVIVNHIKKFLPPVINPPEPIAHPSRNFVGLQHYAAPRDWDKYVAEAHPVATKFFFGGTAIQGKQAFPEMLTVWRKFVSAGTTGRMIEGNRWETSLELLDEYSAEIRTISSQTGMSEEEIVDHIDVLESLNETMPSLNYQAILKSVEFDYYYAQHVFDRYGYDIKSGLLNVAIGNPHETEVEMLLPCAQMSHEGKSVLEYHGYWGADENMDYMEVYWPYHAGRAFEWDKIFTARGLFPTYVLSETGIVYLMDNGAFDPYSGWKQCGDFPNYIAQLERFNARILAWNQQNQGRCYGGTVFIHGHGGWSNFDFAHGDLMLLNEEMKKYA